MKWCMVVAVAVSLFIGGTAWAQDDLDLDALLGSVEPAPAAEVEAADAAAPAADAFAGEASEAAPAVDAFGEFGASEAEASAPAQEDPFAADAMEAAAPAPAAEDDMFGDLFSEPAPEAAAPAAVEEPAPAAFDDFGSYDAGAEAPAADFGAESDAGMGMDEGFAPAGTSRAKPQAEKPSAKEMKKIAKETAEQEEVRRQDAEKKARMSAEAGFREMSAGNFAAAETSFAAALSTLPERAQTADLREQIQWGLAEAQYSRAKAIVERREVDRIAEARKLVDSALKNAPDHRGADALSKRLAKWEAIEAKPKVPSARPETIEKEKTIAQMYDEARQWYMIKDYDRASALFEQILLRDPYNKSAMRYLKKIESDKFKLATYERDARVQGMMTEVRRSWSPPIRAKIEVPESIAKNSGVDSKPASDRLNEKMQKIIIPAVEFRQANINDVVNFLVEASIAADPEKEGVNIILNLGQSGGGGVAAPAPAPMDAGMDTWGDFGGGEDFGAALPAAGGGASGVRDITLNLRRITMLDAIKYITEVAGLKYRIEDSAVMITPLDAPVGNIVTRMYPVQPSFMDVIIERQGASQEEREGEFQSLGGRVTTTKSDVKDFFEKTGVKFPSGASITYNATISQLIVANTADNLETFERILQQLNVVPNQVEIEARFIEVDQNDLEELGLQWILNDNYEFATKQDGSGQRMQVNANQRGLTQGNRFFNLSDNGAISPASTVSQLANQTMLGGILSASSVLTNPEVTVVLQALSQHGGSDLLSAPRVTTRSGVNAQIQVVKEIIYPTEFSSNVQTFEVETANGSYQNQFVVVEPGMFETRETGVILNVTPTVGPDGYTIDLVMAPEVAELVDWIQYGSTVDDQIFNMPMPVFTSRNVTTSIVIWDGQTVVMGGLIREELTTVKDKVPILGDIPLVGRLFRSEGQYSRKKNLLIFVTARLVDPAGRPIHREGLAMPGSGIETDGDVAAAP